MQEAAGKLGTYDELVRMELTEYLASRKGEFYAILAADTLIYFGALDDVIGKAHDALKPGGLLIFTIEEATDLEQHVIPPAGRYSHARDYVERVLEDAGFDMLSLDSGIARFEFGKPVDCLVVSAAAR
jgi:predicted TPR repeat methyltransferase